MHKKFTVFDVLALAIPSIASMLLNNGYRIIDQYSIQWLGTAAQAALGSTSFILIAAFSLFVLISGGVTPIVGRYSGANNTEKRNIAIGQSIKTMSVISLVYCATLVLCSTVIPEFVGLRNDAAQAMETYLFWLGISGFCIAFGPLIDAVYISTGNTRFPLQLQLVFTSCNGLLNWFLIYQLEWGVAGAAIASGVSAGISVSIGMYYIFQDFAPKWQGWEEVQKVIRIGYPIALGVLSYALVYWVMLKISISPLGEEVNAALGIGFSALEGMSWPLFAGMMVATSSLISRQLGAKDEEGLERTLQLTFPISTALGVFVAIVFYNYAAQLCGIFTTDPIVLEQAVMYAQILAISQIFVAWEALSEGVLEGAGDSKTLFWSSVPFNVLRIPLSWLLAIYLGWGAFGVWWTINCTTFIKGGVKMYMVYRRKWKTIEV